MRHRILIDLSDPAIIHFFEVKRDLDKYCQIRLIIKKNGKFYLEHFIIARQDYMSESEGICTNLQISHRSNARSLRSRTSEIGA